MIHQRRGKDDNSVITFSSLPATIPCLFSLNTQHDGLPLLPMSSLLGVGPNALVLDQTFQLPDSSSGGFYFTVLVLIPVERSNMYC